MMAYLRLHTGKDMTIPAEKGFTIWEILQGRREPDNPQQESFVASIKKIYLNRYHPDCPWDYLQERAYIHQLMDNHHTARFIGDKL